jgi:hypothetical protein
MARSRRSHPSQPPSVGLSEALDRSREVDVTREALAALVVGAFASILYAAWRSREIFAVSVRAGRIEAARGRLSTELRHELEDVVASSRASGRVVVRLENGRARVHTKGFGDPIAQRVRNVVGRIPLARLRTAPPARRR